jgi:hypothetical protein
MLSLNHMKNHIESNYGRLVSPVGSFPLVTIGGTPKVSPPAVTAFQRTATLIFPIHEDFLRKPS